MRVDGRTRLPRCRHKKLHGPGYRVYTHVYTHVYTYACNRVYTHACNHVCTHVYTHVYAHVYTHVYTQVSETSLIVLAAAMGLSVAVPSSASVMGCLVIRQGSEN